MTNWLSNLIKQLNTTNQTASSIALMLLLVACGGDQGYKVRKDNVTFGIWDGSKTVIYDVKGADPNSFKVLLEKQLGADNDNVYHQQNLIAGADAKTFKVLNRWHSIDKNRGYHDGKVIPNSISDSFESLNSTVSKDANDVFIATDAIDACDAKSYKLLVNYWATDNECVYSGFNKIKEADLATFQGLNRFYAKDKNRVYITLSRVVDDDKRKSLPIATQKRLDESSTGILRLVYWVENADAETFVTNFDRPIYGRDKSHCYKYDKTIECDLIP